MSLSSSAWFTGDDGPADPPSERPRHPRPTTGVPACEDCDDTGTITDPAPDAPGSRPPEPCVSCPGRTLPVTPAERCLAGMLRAWLDYSPSDECNVDQQNALADIGNRLRRLGVTNTLKATPAGAALLARVEAAERTPLPPVPMLSDDAAKSPTAALLWFADEGHYEGTYRKGAGFAEACGMSIARKALGLLVDRPDNTLMPLSEALAARLAGTTPIDAPPAKEPAPLLSIRACKHPHASGDCYACPDCGVINNCNLENGEPEAECQMCPGKCPNRAQYAAARKP